MRVLICLAGLPGVGKSTISEKIARYTGAKILDLDEFKRTEVDPDLVATEIDPPNVRWAYYEKAITYAFSLETPLVIMDEVFHLQELRLRLESRCQEHDVTVLWIEVRCPYKTVVRRIKKNSRSGHLLSSEQALSMNRRFSKIFDKFPAGSNHVIVNNDDA